ncbi:hypothetical protein [Mucilaginibacter sp.]|uniref:hypothetical protein n=1 Tax=Mucilaginibacter sp. TaxID=1882438 RepID=UPI002617CC44|nr:hypothetical protein [Mucilaginibacter sp.]MDB5128343.1 hypothetical protein [Mucilaginibacter sp.]
MKNDKKQKPHQVFCTLSIQCKNFHLHISLKLIGRLLIIILLHLSITIAKKISGVPIDPSLILNSFSKKVTNPIDPK